MTITTKFDPGQEVWFDHYPASYPQQGTVSVINITQTGKTLDILYTLRVSKGNPVRRIEALLFPSKSELLASL